MTYQIPQDRMFEKLVIVLHGFRGISTAEAKDILRETRWTIYDNLAYLFKFGASYKEMRKCAISIFNDYTGLCGENYIDEFIDWSEF